MHRLREGRQAGKGRPNGCRRGIPVKVDACHERGGGGGGVVVVCRHHTSRLSFRSAARWCTTTVHPVWERRRHEGGRLEIALDFNALALLNGLALEVLEHVQILRASGTGQAERLASARCAPCSLPAGRGKFGA